MWNLEEAAVQGEEKKNQSEAGDDGALVMMTEVKTELECVTASVVESSVKTNHTMDAADTMEDARSTGAEVGETPELGSQQLSTETTTECEDGSADTFEVKPRVESSGGVATEQRRVSMVAGGAKDGVELKVKAKVEVDFAKTYEMKPTVPSSPRLFTERRASIATLIRRAEGGGEDGDMKSSKKAAGDVDLAQTYELKPTVPQSPRLLTERRISMLATLKEPAEPHESLQRRKSAVDLARTYVLQRTIPKSPRFLTELRALQHGRSSTSSVPGTRVVQVEKAEALESGAAKAEVVDLARTYELKPTKPKSPRFSVQIARTLNMLAHSKQETKEKEKDIAETYVLKPTKPSSPRFNWRSKKQVEQQLFPVSESKSEPDLAATYELKPTTPVSPRLHKTRRRDVVEPVKEEPERFRARPMPNFNAATGIVRRQSVHSMDERLERTEAAPFRLASLDRHERYVASFRAKYGSNAIRKRASTGSRTSDVRMERTAPKPFALASVKRHEQALEQFNRWMAESDEALRRKRQFKAQPLSADMLEGATFVARTGQSVTTQARDVVTASRERAERRRDYDRANAQRIAERERMAEEERTAREEAEAEVQRTQQREHGFRARPVPQSLYRATGTGAAGRRSLDVGESSPTGSTYSAGEILGGLRRVIGRLSPRVDA